MLLCVFKTVTDGNDVDAEQDENTDAQVTIHSSYFIISAKARTFHS